jgi:alpha-glucosidase
MRAQTGIRHGTEPVQLPAGSVLLSAASLAEAGWLQPNETVWVLRD